MTKNCPIRFLTETYPLYRWTYNFGTPFYRGEHKKHQNHFSTAIVIDNKILITETHMEDLC